MSPICDCFTFILHCSAALTASHFLLNNCNIGVMSQYCWLLAVGCYRLPAITGTPFSFRVNGKEGKFTRLRLRVSLISVSDQYLGATSINNSCLISCSCSCFVVAMKLSTQQMYSSENLTCTFDVEDNNRHDYELLLELQLRTFAMFCVSPGLYMKRYIFQICYLTQGCDLGMGSIIS